MIPALVFACLTVYPARAAGEGEEQSIVVLEAGDVAPFAGDLYTIARSIRMALRLEGFEERAKLKLEREYSAFEVELKYRDSVQATKLEAKDSRIELLERELGEALAWYRSPVFVTLVAVVATLIASTAVGYTWAYLGQVRQ